MSFDGRPSNANELILWNGIEFYSGKITGNNISNVATVTRISMNTVLGATPQLVLVDVSLSPVTVTMPASPTDGMTVIVKNDIGDASVRHITVSTNAGQTIESPAGIGSLTSSTIINVKGGAVAWSYDTTQTQWIISALAYTPTGVAGGDLGGNYPNPTVIAIQGNAIANTPPTDGYGLVWNAAANKWAPSPPAATIATERVFMFDNILSDTDGYYTLSNNAPDSELDLSASGSSGSGQVLIATFITPVGSPNVTFIPAGLWDFNFWTYVSSGAGVTTLVFSVFVRNADGTSETHLFNTTSDQITELVATHHEIISNVSPGTAVNATDRIVIRVYMQTTSGSAITTHFVFDGSAHPSHVHTPIAGSAILVGGDLFGNTGAALVVSLTGLGGVVSTAASTTTIEFNASSISPLITQASSNASNGQQLVIQAQSTTGASSTGGNLVLASGIGTAVDGYVAIEVGLVQRLIVNPTGVVQIVDLSTGVVHSDASGHLTSSQIVDSDISGSAAISVSKLASGSAAQILLNNSTPTPTWTTVSGDATISNVGVVTLANTAVTPGTYGDATHVGQFIVDSKGRLTSASNVTITGVSPGGSAGGDLSGSYPNPQVAAISGSSPILITPSVLEWQSTTVSPTLTQANSSSASGQTMLVQAQGSTFGSGTGGNLILASGAGTVTDGYVSIEVGLSQCVVVHANQVVQILNLSTGVVHADSSGNLTSSLIVNADVSGSAAIAYSKLNLTNSIVNADINSAAAIAYSKLNLSNSIVNADISTAAAIDVSKLANGTADQLLDTNHAGTATEWFTLGGDATFASHNLTVTKINGASVPAAGSLTTGNVLQVNGSSSLTYGAVNLAGGNNFVTGVLPTGNQAAQSLTLVGDVTGSGTTTSTTTTVTAISGASPIAITPSNLQFTSTTSTPTINQVSTSSGNGTNMLISAQSTTFSGGLGGDLILQSGGSTTGSDGYVSLETGSVQRLTVHPNGVVQITNLSTGVVHSDSSGNLTSSNIVVGTDITPGTADQLLDTNHAGTAAEWFTLGGDATFASHNLTLVNTAVTPGTYGDGTHVGQFTVDSKGRLTFAANVTITGAAPTGAAGGDLSGTYPNPQVASISGSSPIAITPAVLQWTTGTTAPTLTQANNTTNGATAQELLIQAQSATGTTSTGGNLLLASGTGTSVDGYVQISVGQSAAIVVHNGLGVQINSLGTGVVHADSSGNLTSSLVVNADVSASAAIAYSKLNLSNSIVNADINSAAAIAYSKLNLTGSIVNADIASGAAIAVSKLAAGSSTQVLITNGSTPTWTTLSSDVTVSASGVTTVNSISGSSPIAITPANLQWTTGTASPLLSQADKTTNGGTGATLTIQAQNETGTTSTGGGLTLTSGTGTTAAGNILLQAGGTNIAKVDSNKFYTVKGYSQNVTIKAHADTPYTVLATDNIIAADVSGGVLTVTLPSSPAVGDTYAVKDYKGAAATSNITVDSGSGNKIDAAQTFVMDVNYDSITVVCVVTSPVQWMLL